jgi:uncharacterized protein (DUF1697 family)
MTDYVSFLRGINVGGNKTIRMTALKELFESMGFEGAKTLLNSGNVVFSAKGQSRAKLAGAIEAAIEEKFGFRPAIVIRSAAELKKIVTKNPFPAMAKRDPGHVLLMTLASKPKPGAKARLAEVHSGPEQIEIFGANVYLTYPTGVGKSKLTNAVLEKQLGAVGTARNWNTVMKLSALAENFSP